MLARTLSAWTRIPGLVPEQEIVKLFTDKCKRPKKDGRSDSDPIVVE